MKQEKETLELRLGKMSGEELAAWFGVTYNTYKKDIPKRLEELTFYAEFERVRGGVIINTIYSSIYIKGAMQVWDKIYAACVLFTDEGLTSIAGMVRFLKAIRPKKYGDIPDSTMRYRLTRAGNRTFGKTKDKDAVGYLGTREYVWAIRVNELNAYRFMTTEERELFIDLTQKNLNNVDNVEAAWDFELYKSAVHDNEMTREEFVEIMVDKILENQDFYVNVLVPFEIQTGFLPVRATRHEVEQSIARRLLKIPQTKPITDKESLVCMI